MYKRRARRTSRRSGSPYEMQQFSLTRQPMILSDGEFTPVQPFQQLTCLVSPREEHATIFDVNDSPPVPADARGCVVGGMRFRYTYTINMFNNGGAPPVSDFLTIKSALVVCPLDSQHAQTPATNILFPNVLAQQGTQVEDPAGLNTTNYYRPRILWRSIDELPFIGGIATPGAFALTDLTALRNVNGEVTPTLQEVKAKVRLSMDQALYLLTEISMGFSILENQQVVLALSVFGVAAVKRLTRGRGGAS